MRQHGTRFSRRRRAEEPPAEGAPPAGARSPWVQLRSFVSPNPFIFKRMLAGADPAAKAGDIVHVYDKSGALIGSGIYNPRSQIAIRMLASGETPVDEAFW